MKFIKVKNCYECPYLENDHERDKHICIYQNCFSTIDAFFVKKECDRFPLMCLLSDFNNVNNIHIDLPNSEIYYISIDERGIILEANDPICYMLETDISIIYNLDDAQIEQWVEENA